ncbi:hypothetical protein [Rurimicrobium arvi]|uniref:Uncharacterized protein n=1 Tax=Rurimicrobium arvi TaxID=2049916 RepID=A0ABP8MYR0_9BACT
MDSVYLVTTKPKTEKENFFSLIDCCIKHGYYFQTNGYMEDQISPKLAISLSKTWEGDTIITGKYISTFIFNDKAIHDRYENFPVIKDGAEYFPIFAFECEEADFLLDFVVAYLKDHIDCYIANVALRIQDINLLQQYKQEDNHKWMYEGVWD